MKRAEWYDVPYYWPQIAKKIKAALAERSLIHTADDLYLACLAREMTLWLALDGDEARAATIVQIQRHPRATVCVMFAIGGEGMGSWIHFAPEVEAWAKEQGCIAIEAAGRKGWERRVKGMGYEPIYVVYRRIL